jgi:hypothetical protein
MVLRRAVGVGVLGSACAFAVVVGGSTFRWPPSPNALSCSPALRALSLKDVVAVALTTDTCRAAIMLQAGISRGLDRFGLKESVSLPLDHTIARLLTRKADGLDTGILSIEDDTIIEVAPNSLETALEIPGLLEARMKNGGGRVVAVLLAPDHFVSNAVLERYGAALVAGMGVWQQYIDSLSSVGPPALPTSDSQVTLEDLTALDQLLVILGKLCDMASVMHFDIILSIGRDIGRDHSHEDIGPDPPRYGYSDSFHRALAVAHIATCLARAFSSPNPDDGTFPSVILSADSMRDIRAVDLLAEYTKVKLSLRVAFSQLTNADKAYSAAVALAPSVVAVPGIQRIPSGQAQDSAVFEYTRGIGDLQSARLRYAIVRDNSRHQRPQRAMVRREFAGKESKLYASFARTPLCREALREESIALWSKVRSFDFVWK